MTPEDQIIKQWITKVFDNDILSKNEIMKLFSDFRKSSEASDISKSPGFYYELAKVNSEAIFLLWQLQFQERLKMMLKKSSPDIDFENVQVNATKLFPLVDGSKFLYLNNGKVFLLDDFFLKVIEKPLAFRKLIWKETSQVGKEVSSYTENDLKILLKDEIVYVAAIIAGAKYKSYKLAVEYSSKRNQGGRAIKNWTSIQAILSELYLSVKRDEVLIRSLSLSSAFLILKDADDFVSTNMQVFGGAGYTEDYVVERLYRECIFLKNWPKPFKQELITHYQNQTREL